MSAVILGACALFFTIFSFWWMNWRPGRLVVARPRSFAVMRPSNGDALILAVPIVLVNTGALPIIVQNLRLVIPAFGSEVPFILQATATTLAFKAEHTLAVQFPVRSREATTVIGEFYRAPANAVFEAKVYTVQLQGLLNKKSEWTNLCSFELRIHSQNVLKINQPGFQALDNEAGTHQMLDAIAAQRTRPNAS